MTYSTLIHSRISTVVRLSEDVLFMYIKPNQVFTETDFLDLQNAASIIGEAQQRFHNIIYLGRNTIPNRTARLLSASKSGSIYKRSDHFVVSNSLQRAFGKIIMKMDNPTVPTFVHDDLTVAAETLSALYGITVHPSQIDGLLAHEENSLDLASL